MQLKYKIAIIGLVGALIIAILYFPPTAELPQEAETSPETVEVTEFKPNEDPYVDYLRARNEGRPILLEFYARY